MERFPNIYSTCLEYGMDITKEPIPVVPAAHYQCGGVMTNVDGADGYRRDFTPWAKRPAPACTAPTAWPAIPCWKRWSAPIAPPNASAKLPIREPTGSIPAWQSGSAHNLDELVVINHNWDEIRRMMWDYVGIVRTNKRLQRARSRIANLQEEIQEYYWDFIVNSDLLELRNIATVAELIIDSALLRPESRGLHYNLDYPAADPAWAQRDTVLRKPV